METLLELPANHNTICKYDSADACEMVLETIADEVSNALKLASGNKHWIVPRSPNRMFTGRGSVITKIVNTITSSNVQQQRRFVITGMGGQGKSEICLKLCSEMRDRFWAVCWVDVGSKRTASDGFSKIAKLLGAVTEDSDGALTSLANLSHNQSWLLILDNADDIDFDYSCYLPSGDRGVVIMTSRNPECGRAYHTVGWERLDNLDANDCVGLLMKSAKVPPEFQSKLRADAISVIDAVGSHTLAILQAGAYIALGYCQMAMYPDLLNQNRKQLMEFQTTQDQSRYRTAYATLEASMQMLERSADDEASQDAAQLLQLLSTFHYENFPLDMLESAWKGAYRAHRNSPEDERIDHLLPLHAAQLPQYLCPERDTWQSFRLVQAVNRLESLALVRKVDTVHDNSVSMHPLTHEWENLRQTDRQSQLLSCECAVALAASQGYQDGWRPWWDRFGTHLLRLVRADEHLIDRAAQSRGNLQVCFRMMYLLHYFRYPDDLDPLLKRIFGVLDLDDQAPTKDFAQLYELAALHANSQGDLPKSIHIFKELAQRFDYTESANEQSLEVLSNIQRHLGILYLNNGQTKQSVEVLEKLLESEKQVLPENHNSMLSTQEYLADAYKMNNQAQNAIDILKRIVHIHEKNLDEAHPLRLGSQHNLAAAFLEDYQTQDAIDIFRKVVQIRDMVLTENHPNRLTSQHGLGVAYLKNGQVQEAIQLLEHVENISRTSLDESHPSRLITQHWLGWAYVQADRLPEAIRLLEHVNCIYNLTLEADNGKQTSVRRDLEEAYKLRDEKSSVGSEDSSTAAASSSKDDEPPPPSSQGKAESEEAGPAGRANAATEFDEAGKTPRRLGFRKLASRFKEKMSR